MGKKRNDAMTNIDMDCDKVNEILKKRKKKKSSKVLLSEKTPGESSARTRGIEDSLDAIEIVPTMVNHDGVAPHPNMHVTPVHSGVVAHDGFHFSSMVSSLEQTFDGLEYDPNNLMASTNVCDQFYESMSKVTHFFYRPKKVLLCEFPLTLCFSF